MSTKIAELRVVLAKLDDESLTVSFSDLYALSDLAGERMQAFLATWALLTHHRRHSLLRSMVKLAETSFEVNFDAIFRKCLNDPDPGVRGTAVEGLWENDSVSLIGPYLNLLRMDPSPSVREAAASGLGRFVLAGELEKIEAPVQHRILAELLAVLHLPSETAGVRRRALESAAYACIEEISEALEIAYHDDDELMRISSVVGMGRSCDRRWQSIVLKELKSASPAMRYEAALACGELALTPAVPLLAQLITDSDREISSAAIWALGEIGGTAAVQALMAAHHAADADRRGALDDALAVHALSRGFQGMAYPTHPDLAENESSFEDDQDSPWLASDVENGYDDLDDWEPSDDDFDDDSPWED